MKELISILQGGLFPFLACIASGLLVLRWLLVRLQPIERFGLAAALGATTYSLLLLPLLEMGELRRGVSTALSLGVVLAGILFARPFTNEAAPSGPRFWTALSCVGSLLFFSVWLLNALAPVLTSSVALEQAAAMANRGFIPDVERLSAASPLWLAAFAIGRHAACSLLNTLFLASLAALVYGSVRRWMGAPAAAIAGLLLITNPGLGAIATHAGSELLLLLLATAAIAFLLLAWHSRQPGLAVAAALTATHAMILARDPQAEFFRGFLFALLPGPWLVLPLACALVAWLFRGHPASAMLLLGFAFLTSWPRVTRMLAPPGPPTVLIPNPKLALRQAGAEAYRRSQLPGYLEARLLDEFTLVNSKILAEPTVALSWTSREVIPAAHWLHSARTAYDDAYRPDHEERINLPQEPRATWTRDNDALVTEARFYHRGQEVSRHPSWKVSCAEAFDHNPGTGCRQNITVHFGRDTLFDQVRLTGQRGDPIALPTGLREALYQHWKRQRVTHILALENQDLADQLSRHSAYWHVKDVGGRDGLRLFRLE